MATPWVEVASYRPVLDLDLSQPTADRLAALPQDLVDAGRELLTAVMQEVPDTARSMAPMLSLITDGRWDDEIHGLADRIGADWEDVALANVSYDLVINFFGCSTMVLPTPDGPVVARNMDWWPEDVLARCSCLTRYHHAGQDAFWAAGWPGAVGVVTGLSNHGFVVIVNAVGSTESPTQAGMPVLLFVRQVLEEATSFDQALEMLSHQDLLASGLFTLAGAENHQRVVVERTPTRHALRWANDGEALVCTNDYRLLFPPAASMDGAEIYQTTCIRYDHLTEALATHSPEAQVTDEALLFLLTDANVIQSITAQHVVLRPRQKTVRLFVPARFIAA